MHNSFERTVAGRDVGSSCSPDRPDRKVEAHTGGHAQPGRPRRRARRCLQRLARRVLAVARDREAGRGRRAERADRACARADCTPARRQPDGARRCAGDRRPRRPRRALERCGGDVEGCAPPLRGDRLDDATRGGRRRHPSRDAGVPRPPARRRRSVLRRADPAALPRVAGARRPASAVGRESRGDDSHPS